ncbi:MAG TPA: phytanoyl-CoA dioxygenase family protein [Planctomycetota bacterium]|nr:phytanoyl-CoA dioxygenase family protein [Planctomycetota bacterium]
MKITERQISEFKRNGYVCIHGFVSADEARAALEGVYALVAPSYENWIASGKRNSTIGQRDFPWDHSGLNALALHPDLIDAAERIIGTRELRLCTGHVWMKYSGEDYGQGFHIDYPNNTLGPIQSPDDFQHITFLYYLDDVDEDLAPVLMTPNGRDDSAAVPVTGRAGSVCIYSIYTRHSASVFRRAGQRPAMWVTVARKDRPWDMAVMYSVNSDAAYKGMARVMAESSARQIEFLGFPPAGDGLWTPEFLEGMATRYPGFDPEKMLSCSAVPASSACRAGDR